MELSSLAIASCNSLFECSCTLTPLVALSTTGLHASPVIALEGRNLPDRQKPLVRWIRRDHLRSIKLGCLLDGPVLQI